MKREEALVDLRTTLEWVKDEVKVIDVEVDPELEAAAICKALDEGPAFVFNTVKGYPHARYTCNLLSTWDRFAKIVGAKDHKDIKFKLLEAMKNPIPPQEVRTAPCQEIVIPKEEFDPLAMLPLPKWTEDDGGRFFGSGVHYISGKYAAPGSQLAHYRMSFREKTRASINMVPGGHGDLIATKFKNEKIPCTVNICPPIGVSIMAIGTGIPSILPFGIDEMGIAGGIHGAPIDIVKAKTVDAYAIANSEWVIEGYINPNERMWETEEAERLGIQGVAPFHPEWARYLGRAYRATRTFEVTALTRRKDKPLYYIPLIANDSVNQIIEFNQACWMELGERLLPGFVVDCNSFQGLTCWSGVVFQVRKQRRSDEGMQRNLIAAALGAVRGMRMVIVVDEDINIYSPEDLLFAINTRVNPETDIIRGVGARGQSFQPAERHHAGAGAGLTRPTSVFEGGIGYDATVPLGGNRRPDGEFFRGHYAVDKIDLRKWFTEQEIKDIKAGQSEYVRFLGEAGLS